MQRDAIAVESEEATRQRIREEAERVAAAAAAAAENDIGDLVEMEVQRINNEVLTLKCPCRCNQVYFDNDACAAVSCDVCNVNFCGLCLAVAEDSLDAHTHVRLHCWYGQHCLQHVSPDHHVNDVH